MKRCTDLIEISIICQGIRQSSNYLALALLTFLHPTLPLVTLIAAAIY